MVRNPLPTMVTIAAAWFLTGAASATEIYKWVGTDGVTHYAETPPGAELAGLEVLDVERRDTTEPTPPPNYQSALDVAKSIEASRLERERLRLEKDKLQQQRVWAQESAVTPQGSDGYDGSRRYLRPYYPYSAKPLRHPLHRHHPYNPYPRYGHRYAPRPYGGRGGPSARVHIRR